MTKIKDEEVEEVEEVKVVKVSPKVEEVKFLTVEQVRAFGGTVSGGEPSVARTRRDENGKIVAIPTPAVASTVARGPFNVLTDGTLVVSPFGHELDAIISSPGVVGTTEPVVVEKVVK